jgi:hypothetical protein
MDASFPDEPIDEKYARERFTIYLRDHLHISNIAWKPQQPRPDYCLTLDGKSFAVEVTQIEVKVLATGGKDEVLQKDYFSSDGRFVNDVEETARRAGILKGSYAVTLDRPLGASNARLKRVKSQVSRELQEYIRATQYKDTSPEHVVHYAGEPVCIIEKYSKHGAKVIAALWDPRDGPLESPKFKNEACERLQHAITTKQDLLKNEEKPKILLVLNADELTPSPLYQQCVSMHHWVDFFHSIFVIDVHEKTDEKVYPIYTSFIAPSPTATPAPIAARSR